ncbi:MAG TPA: hypothetical protein VFY16_07965 [Gemmatimonadaceae bacterium]|nr:hypothetical protein [Gemmatimonadaceae bacterium]
MRESSRRRTLTILSVVFAAAPFTFALIRAFSGRYDLRMLWMAMAALVGAFTVMTLDRARRRGSRGIVALSTLALLAATLLAGVTAYQLGATAAAGIGLVALVLGLCWGASFALNALARPQRPAREDRHGAV